MSDASLLTSFMVAIGFSFDQKGAEKAQKSIDGVADRAGKGAEKADRAAKQQAQSFKDSFTSIVKGAGVAIAGITAWVAGIDKLAGGYETLYQQAKKSGASAQELKSFGLGMAQFGVSADQTTASMADLGARIKSGAGYANQLDSVLSWSGKHLKDLSACQSGECGRRPD